MRSLLLVPFLFAAVSVAQDQPRGLTAEGGEKAAQSFGLHGGWLIQSQDRLERLLGELAKAGARSVDQLGKIDFEKDNVLCVFHYGDAGDRFSLHKADGDEKSLNVRVVMAYIIYKQRPRTPPAWKLFAAPVPRSQSTTVTVATYHPFNGGPYPTPDKADPEWKWTFSAGAGEATGGLTCHIEPRAGRIKPGEDILLRARLLADDAAIDGAPHFAPWRSDVLRVWDNKYSNGYRNDAYEVVTPEGKTVIVQSPVIDQWDKNVPHPVEVLRDKPYELVNWAEGDKFKSLKQRGLDTTRPGKYAITCIYRQTAGLDDSARPAMWTGSVRSNTVVVEVK